MTLQQTLNRLRTQLPANLQGVVDWMDHAAQFRCAVNGVPAFDFLEAARRLIQEDPLRAAQIMAELAVSHPLVGHTLGADLRGERAPCRPPVPSIPGQTQAAPPKPELPATSNEVAKPDLRLSWWGWTAFLALVLSSSLVSIWAVVQIMEWLRGLWS